MKLNFTAEQKVKFIKYATHPFLISGVVGCFMGWQFVLFTCLMITSFSIRKDIYDFEN